MSTLANGGNNGATKNVIASERTSLALAGTARMLISGIATNIALIRINGQMNDATHPRISVSVMFIVLAD